MSWSPRLETIDLKAQIYKKIDLLCSPRGTRKVSSKGGKHEENYTIKIPYFIGNWVWENEDETLNDENSRFAKRELSFKFAWFSKNYRPNYSIRARLSTHQVFFFKCYFKSPCFQLQQNALRTDQMTCVIIASTSINGVSLAHHIS